ncbi:MAG: SdrD B-like domain-containing protein [Propionibacteriaceae bacterium]|nr:SdrD B-like domain-containing protein [Propionibacteriaceae bacterium]
MQVKRSGVWAAFALSISLILSAFLGAPSAHAANNPDIKLTVDRLVRYTATVGEQPGILRASGGALIEFSYDATAANPQPGDSFTLDLPSEFSNYEIGKSVDLRFGNEVAGECRVENSQTITCTFNEAIRGKTDIKGKGSLVVRADRMTTKTTVEFNLNGQVTQVPLPDGGGIGDPLGEFRPFRPTKWVGTMLPSNETARWEIVFGAANLPSDLGAPDNVGQVVWKDTLGAGHTFVTDPAQWQLVVINTQDQGAHWQVVATGEGKRPNTSHGEFSIKVEFNNPDKPTEATITAAGPFRADANYLIRYYSQFQTDTGKPGPGVQYSNHAELMNSQKDVKVSAVGHYIDTFTVTIEMKDGFGGFQITKLLAGDGAPNVAASSKFTALASWELPTGKTAADYPGWQAPSNPVEVEVEAGKIATYPGVFPVGTKITVTEDPKTANPASPVEWSEPVFKIGDETTTSSATFTIENQQSTHVNLTNVASPVTGRVSVGDYVWFDANKDGIQNEGDSPLAGVELTLTGPDGGPVTDVNGQPVAPIKTDVDGKYLFVDLPVLQDGEAYTVTVTAPEGYTPTVAGQGDREIDSSTGSATSQGLTKDGESDLTLDFGFIKPEPTPPAPSESPMPTPPPASPTPSESPTPNTPSTPAPSPTPSGTTPPVPTAAKTTPVTPKPGLPKTGS